MATMLSRTELNNKLTRDSLQDAIDSAFNKTLRKMLNDGKISTTDFGRYSRATLRIQMRQWDQ